MGIGGESEIETDPAGDFPDSKQDDHRDQAIESRIRQAKNLPVLVKAERGVGNGRLYGRHGLSNEIWRELEWPAPAPKKTPARAR